jgi:DNA-binding transcriptional MerR regulator
VYAFELIEAGMRGKRMATSRGIRASMQQPTDNPKRKMTDRADFGDGDAEFMPTIPLPKRLPTKPIAIADMANFFGVTHRTLHFYEEKKLLQPSRIGAMRVYSPRQVQVMALITLCRETGMPVVQIQELLLELNEAPSQSDCDRIFHDALSARRKELLADESLIRRQMQQINEILDHDRAGHASDGNDNLKSKIPFLTEFEYECLRLMAEGYTPVRISAALDRPMDDIMATESGIIRKFGSSNRFQAVAKAVLLGLIGD